MFDFNYIEVIGIVVISVTVMVVMWFLTDLSGADRLLNTGISGIVAATAAALSLFIAHQLHIDNWR